MYSLIYAKTKDMKTFKPLDVQNGQIVTNLIYASTWFGQNCKAVANDVILELQKENPDIEFKVVTHR